MRLLTSADPSYSSHTTEHGALVLPPRKGLLDAVDRSGLLGRGGAGFPLARKLRTVAAGAKPVVLANGCEGEPASSKDLTLMTRHPHLVLDGLAVAARAIGATEAHLALHTGSPALRAIAKAQTERRDAVRVQLHEVPVRYVASEESALVNFVNTGTALPTFTPPRPFEQGIGRRPTLVNNVETLAHLALIARHGADWFRSLGDPDEPGTHLITVDGAVVEVPTGQKVSSLLSLTGLQAVLVGGYFGTWVPASVAADLTMTHRDLHAAGGALGAGIVAGLPTTSCGVLETARIATYLASQSAGQCGPCLNGLPSIARALTSLALGPWDDSTMAALDRWLGVVPGRGACRHPDGAVRFVLSGLAVFADDVAAHRAGHPCAGIGVAPLMPVGAAA